MFLYLVYNKKGFPFVSDYKRDIFDKYTLIYWIQESYPQFCVFLVEMLCLESLFGHFAKKYQKCFEFPKYLYLNPQTKSLGYGVMVTLQDSGPVIPGSNPGSPTKTMVN